MYVAYGQGKNKKGGKESLLPVVKEKIKKEGRRSNSNKQNLSHVVQISNHSMK